ncbi:hypothetical protein QWJ26_39525 [Streptomyces sp. CSDS2]|uniref:hypothetical protein n=1 Tax=Streptomyces sp. CSDS2 TaxID=3055051 RepID=UPI0025B26E52|nr:hypothetical protein [Streptomyces sp. CSDS2]MDN3265784.1 hypothetical protein [Streptomyces sp. CSDS2]
MLTGASAAVYLVPLTLDVGTPFNHPEEITALGRSVGEHLAAVEGLVRAVGGALPAAPSLWAGRKTPTPAHSTGTVPDEGLVAGRGSRGWRAARTGCWRCCGTATPQRSAMPAGFDPSGPRTAADVPVSDLVFRAAVGRRVRMVSWRAYQQTAVDVAGQIRRCWSRRTLSCARRRVHPEAR